MWTGFSWLRAGASNKLSVSINGQFFKFIFIARAGVGFLKIILAQRFNYFDSYDRGVGWVVALNRVVLTVLTHA